jgi:hypothetical protein
VLKENSRNKKKLKWILFFNLYTQITTTSKMRMTQYHDGDLDINESIMIAYLWNMEYENLQERCTDDMTFDDFEDILTSHILGSVVGVLMKNEYNCNLVKDLYNDMTGKDAEEEEEEA